MSTVKTQRSQEPDIRDVPDSEIPSGILSVSQCSSSWEQCEEWDMSTQLISPRSKLYRLEPIGVGTPYVESLSSYFRRLADAHCVSPCIFFKGRSLHSWASDIWSKAQLQSGIPSWEPLI